jgi:hypothetical protein
MGLRDFRLDLPDPSLGSLRPNSMGSLWERFFRPAASCRSREATQDNLTPKVLYFGAPWVPDRAAETITPWRRRMDTGPYGRLVHPRLYLMTEVFADRRRLTAD